MPDERKHCCVRSRLGYRWRQGDPSLADAEARLYDIGVLRSVLEEIEELTVVDALGVTHQAVIKRYGTGGGH